MKLSNFALFALGSVLMLLGYMALLTYLAAGRC